jgi:2-phosphoglycerate kinase
MAQSITATGLPPERAFTLASLIEARLTEAGGGEVGVAELRGIAEAVLLEEEGETALRRYRQWWRLGRLDRPLVILLGGVTGVGKSTVASQLANRLGITRVVATDQVRQVVRAFFSHEFLPAVHHSSFDVGERVIASGTSERAATIEGFLQQVSDIAPGVDALVERAVSERSRIIVEGVHLLPNVPSAQLCRRAVTVRALLAVRDEQAHRAHFHMRGLQAARPPGRYLEAFDRIRVLQDYLIESARAAAIPIVDEGGLEPTLKRVMEVVLDAVGTEDIDVPTPPGGAAAAEAPAGSGKVGRP